MHFLQQEPDLAKHQEVLPLHITSRQLEWQRLRRQQLRWWRLKKHITAHKAYAVLLNGRCQGAEGPPISL